MSKAKNVIRNILVCMLALSIPAMLGLNAVESRKYMDLRKDIISLEDKQEVLIEENKSLITDISQLSGSDRIEMIAKEKLDMRPAASGEIVRVEMKGN